jgi:DNA-binding NtrC family response regulator
MAIAVKKMFLVLENSPEDAFLIGHAFSLLHDCSSHICRNTNEARAYLKGTGGYKDRNRYPFPHAVMSDLHLGPESGIEFFNWMEKSEEFEPLQRVLLTGSASPRDLTEAAKIPRLKIIEKPMDLAALKKIVGCLCETI